MKSNIIIECKNIQESEYIFDFKFLQIEWKDPWFAILLTFHVAITMTALMTRNHANFQILLFLVLCKYISTQL